MTIRDEHGRALADTADQHEPAPRPAGPWDANHDARDCAPLCASRVPFGECTCGAFDERNDEPDELPYCANCDAPFSPLESGYAETCCAECREQHHQRTGD